MLRSSWLFILVILMLTPLGLNAEDMSPQSPQATIEPSYDPMEKNCRTSQLTQEKFIEMIHTIAMHGDLTDIPFIEKTLQIKLQINKGDVLQQEYPKIQSYSTTGTPPILGAPIGVYLYFNPYPDEQQLLKKDSQKIIGHLDFSSLSVTNPFHDCGYLMKDIFDEKFGGRFDSNSLHSPHVMMAKQNLGKIGKNNSDIEVLYEYTVGNYRADNAIYNVIINQRIPRH